MLVPRIGGFEVGLRFDLEELRHDLGERRVRGVRSILAAPAVVVADSVFRDIAQRMIQDFNSELTRSTRRISARRGPLD